MSTSTQKFASPPQSSSDILIRIKKIIIVTLDNSCIFESSFLRGKTMSYPSYPEEDIFIKSKINPAHKSHPQPHFLEGFHTDSSLYLK